MNNIIQKSSKHITSAIAAEKLGFSASYVRRLLRGGKLKGEKLGHDWILKLSEIDRYKNKFMKTTETSIETTKEN